MSARKWRYASRTPGRRAIGLLRATVWAVLALSTAGFSFSRPSSRAPEFPRRFELTVRETRDESVYDARTDSVGGRRFESTLVHFGRIEPDGRSDPATPAGGSREGSRKKPSEEGGAAHTVFNDSLVFRSDAPFRYAALVRRDTLAVTSMEKGPSTRAAPLEADREMLTCIFEGPALRIRVSGAGEPARIEDLKTACPGGLYRRVNLPVTLGAFIFPVPSGGDRPGMQWRAPVTCPSFSGLGPSPSLILAYRTVKNAGPVGAAVNFEMTCDTTIANVRSVTPAGDTINVISRRVRVHGIVRRWQGLPSFHAGELSIEEDVRYVRPDLESPVLEKRSRVEIRLEPRY